MQSGRWLAKARKKVLLIDFDPQASLTASLGYKHPDELDDTIGKFVICFWIGSENDPAFDFFNLGCWTSSTE